jgi:hypothetical protein
MVPLAPDRDPGEERQKNIEQINRTGKYFLTERDFFFFHACSTPS